MCCLVIWRACDGFEVASEYLGRNLSEGVRGGTINAISSSIPELLTTLIGLVILSNQEGFAVGLGTTAGSAVFNGMVIPAVCIFAVVGTVVCGRKVDSVLVSAKVLWRDGLSLLGCEICLIAILSTSTLRWWHGLLLMTLYVAFLSYMLISMRSNQSQADDSDSGKGLDDIEEDLENDDVGGGVLFWLSGGPLLDLESIFVGDAQQEQIDKGQWNGWPLLIASTSVIGAACYFLVKACEWLGTGTSEHPNFSFFGFEMVGLGIPTLFVSVIFASMATSVPDTVISIRDARDGDYDDAVANALGSNIFDICFALGLPVFCFTLINGPIEIDAETAAQSGGLRAALLVLTSIAFVIYVSGKRKVVDGITVIPMGKIKAAMLISMYGIFLVYIIGLVNGNSLSMGIESNLEQLSQIFNQQ